MKLSNNSIFYFTFGSFYRLFYDKQFYKDLYSQSIGTNIGVLSLTVFIVLTLNCLLMASLDSYVYNYIKNQEPGYKLESGVFKLDSQNPITLPEGYLPFLIFENNVQCVPSISEFNRKYTNKVFLLLEPRLDEYNSKLKPLFQISPHIAYYNLITNDSLKTNFKTLALRQKSAAPEIARKFQAQIYKFEFKFLYNFRSFFSLLIITTILPILVSFFFMVLFSVSAFIKNLVTKKSINFEFDNCFRKSIIATIFVAIVLLYLGFILIIRDWPISLDKYN